jgi:hypothetical protein
LLVVVGVLLLSMGLGGGTVWSTAAYIATLMGCWTLVLPRLSILRPLSAFFASHALAAGAFWAALAAGSASFPVIAATAIGDAELRSAFVRALGIGAVALGIGVLLSRAIERRPAAMHRVLGLALIPILMTTALALVLASGDAPRASGRVAEMPVVARIPPGPGITHGAPSVVRAPDGAFVPLRPTWIESALAGGPSIVSRLHTGTFACTGVPSRSTIEVRRVGALLVYTQEHGLDDPNAWPVRGCAYDEHLLTPAVLYASALPQPIGDSTTMMSLAIAGLLVALIHIVIALRLQRHLGRIELAHEARAIGSGMVTLADGTQARCDAAEGSVLVEIEPAHAPGADYRHSAVGTARLLARGTRDTARSALHQLACAPLVGASSALLAVAMAALARLVSGYVVPL